MPQKKFNADETFPQHSLTKITLFQAFGLGFGAGTASRVLGGSGRQAYQRKRSKQMRTLNKTEAKQVQGGFWYSGLFHAFGIGFGVGIADRLAGGPKS